MPELPEVETIIRDLTVHLVNKTIKQVSVIYPGSINQKPVKFIAHLEGQKIKNLSRRGKNIILQLTTDYLVIHLKMTGQLVWRGGQTTLAGGHPIINVGQELPNKFTRVILKFAAGTLYFNDVRKFGWVRIMTALELELYLQRLGVEPLGIDFTKDYLQTALAAKHIAIKAALLDQSKIAGLGNIYVDEALWASGIAPTRPANSLSKPELKKLQQAIVAVLNLSISQRGTSFNNYRDGNGEAGNNMKFLKVYGRANEACPKCRRPLKKFRLAGRGTHWCDHCQK
ncbi:MAG TPA: bifunctional DNA-formamidopyrimidine glycosylase/DNA-(apurinic or apyrimidinic site) lyase [bacterium]|nr:bifunctional DNA-formamidopyrimidine glycosylase/DNA-(apurinic or apyrimidinic site) lyase [bacterium]